MLAANGGLGIERLQVESEVAVNVFVVVALGELAELPAEAFVAGVVLAGGAPAVAAPVAEALGVGLERGTADDVHRPTLAHGEMVRRIERLGGNIAPGAGVAGDIDSVGRDAGGILGNAERLGAGDGHRVSAAEGVAVVLDQPEVVLAAKFEDGADVEGIAQGVGDHDGLGLAGDKGGLELLGADVARNGVVIEEDGDGAELDDGRDGGGETGGDGDDLIAGQDAFVRGELVRGERGEGDEVGRGAGVDEEAVFHAKEGGELLLEGFALGAEGEPEVEGGAHGGLDLVFVEHATGVGDGLARGPRSVRGVVAGTLALVHERGIFAGEAENLGFEFGSGRHVEKGFNH